MKFYVLLVILSTLPQWALSKELTLCHFTFHLIKANDEITAQPYLDSADISVIEKRFDRTSGKEIMYLKLTDRGARINSQISKAHIGRYVAIFCDGKLLSKPRIMDVIENEFIFTIE